jgi:hypothetical protein
MHEFKLIVLYKPNNTCPVNTAFLRNQTFFYIYNLQTYNFQTLWRATGRPDS